MAYYCVLQMIVALIIYLEQKKAIVTSGVLFLMFLVLSVFGLLSLYTHILHALKVSHCLRSVHSFHSQF